MAKQRLLRDAGIWLLQKLELGLRISAKLCLLIPVILGMVYFSFSIDPAGIFRVYRDSIELEALALLDGQALTGYDQLAERKVMAMYVENMEEPVETVALGSSRILQLRAGGVGTSFYNCGMSGGDFYDLLGNYYLFEKAGMLPQNLIIACDPWLFNPNEDAYSQDSDRDLYNEFLSLALGYNTGWTPQPEEETGLWVDIQNGKYDSLFDPGYFQASLQLYGKVPEVEERQPSVVTGDLYSQKSNIKLADGSVVYQQDFRTQDQETVDKLAVGHAATFVRMDNFYTLDAHLCEVFERFVQHVQEQGVNVLFVMTPYHPTVYNYATENAETYTGFFAAQEWFVDYALSNDIPLYGAYNPFVLGCTSEDFYDGLHIREEALARIVPDMDTILAAQAAGEAGSEWLFADVLVEYEVAESLVAERYGIFEPEVMRRAEDQEIHGEACYVVERWEHDGPDAILLAWYAVTQNEGVVYRLDTDLDEWVVDSRF